MKKAESTRPLRSNRTDDPFLMQLVLNRRPTSNSGSGGESCSAPHLGRGPHGYCGLPLDRPLADVISNICEVAMNKMRKVNFPHESSCATFHLSVVQAGKTNTVHPLNTSIIYCSSNICNFH